MSFFRKQGREAVSTVGIDDKDLVMDGIKFNVVFLGSMLVPTPTGHGSCRTENAVEKIYQEKYKAFAYGSKKVNLEISDETIKIFENSSGKNLITVASFSILDVTYCNSDIKHEKAFVFVVADATQRTYRAYVFHCESANKVREILTKFKEAFELKGRKIEVSRLRSYSAPQDSQPRFDHEFDFGVNNGTKNQEGDQTKGEDTWGDFEGSHPLTVINGQNQRQRSNTDLLSEKHLIVTQDFSQKFAPIPEEQKKQLSFNSGTMRNDSNPDEFTVLAEKRLRSFDDRAKSGSGEGFLLMNELSQTVPQQHFTLQSILPTATKAENENLLEF